MADQQRAIKFAPSILSADFLHLGDQIDLAIRAGADYLHFDVMDGQFVPNISFGLPVFKAAATKGLPCDVHLMIDRPEQLIEAFAEAGASVITVHAEATRHLQRLLAQIRACGCRAGVALNPATDEHALSYVLDDVDLVLAMTVNPGFGGQKMLPAVLQKTLRIRQMLEAAGSGAEIEVDGGVSLQTAPLLIRHGANVLVAGSAFYGAQDPAGFVKAIRGESINR